MRRSGRNDCQPARCLPTSRLGRSDPPLPNARRNTEASLRADLNRYVPARKHRLRHFRRNTLTRCERLRWTGKPHHPNSNEPQTERKHNPLRSLALRLCPTSVRPASEVSTFGFRSSAWRPGVIHFRVPSSPGRRPPHPRRRQSLSPAAGQPARTCRGSTSRPPDKADKRRCL